MEVQKWAYLASQPFRVSFRNSLWTIHEMENHHFIRPNKFTTGRVLDRPNAVVFLPPDFLHNAADAISSLAERRPSFSVRLTDRLVQMGLPDELQGRRVLLEIKRRNFMVISGGVVHYMGYPFTVHVVCSSKPDSIFIRLRYG